MNKYKSFLFLLVILGVVVDQILKYWMDTSLEYAVANPVLPFLNWTLVYNKGAAFSFLAEHPGWQRWLLMGISLIASIVFTIWLIVLKEGQKFTGLGVAFILSGAIGNLIDRTILGYVVDFIDVYYDQYHWPIFNVADICVCIGVALLLINSFFEKESNG